MGDNLEDIRRLKARYFRTMDQKDWDAWGQVFAAEAVMEVPEVDVVLTGRDAIVKFVSRALAAAQTVHHGHMPEIDVTGPDTATGIWAMSDYVEWPASEGGERSGLRALLRGVRPRGRRLAHRPHPPGPPAGGPAGLRRADVELWELIARERIRPRPSARTASWRCGAASRSGAGPPSPLSSRVWAGGQPRRPRGGPCATT